MACHVTAEAIANNLNESNSDMEIITENGNRELDSSTSEYDDDGGIEALSDVEVSSCASSTNLPSSSSNDISVSSIESSSTDNQRPLRNLLQVLKAPQKSSLSRKRKVASNPPIGQRRRIRGNSLSDPKKVTAQQRVQEYSSEPFTVSAGKLFCNGFREELSRKRSSINNHVKCSKHKERKMKLATKNKSEKDIAKALQKHNEEIHLVGETLPEAQQVFRVKVVHAFLKAGVPLNMIDCVLKTY